LDEGSSWPALPLRKSRLPDFPEDMIVMEPHRQTARYAETGLCNKGGATGDRKKVLQRAEVVIL
jgi:hypothetical protein